MQKMKCDFKDSSSWLLWWRLRLEEYKYEIEYVKGKEDKVADCLSLFFPISNQELSQQVLQDIDTTPEFTKDQLPVTEVSYEPIPKAIITRDELLKGPNKIKLPEGRRKNEERRKYPKVRQMQVRLFQKRHLMCQKTMSVWEFFKLVTDNNFWQT